MRYQYFISFNAGGDWSEFFPKKEALTSYQREPNEIFYRKKLASKISIGKRKNATVYATLESWFTDDTKFQTVIEYEIYRGDRTGTLYYQGKASINDGELDKELNIYSAKIITNDNYQDFIDQAKAEYGILNAGYSNELFYPEVVSLGSWVNVGFETFTASSGTITSAIETGANGDAYSPIGTVTNGTDIVIYIKTYTLNSGNNPFMEIRNTGGGVISETIEITETGEYRFNITSTTVGRFHFFSNAVTNFGLTFEIFVFGTISNRSNTYLNFISTFITAANYMGLATYSGNIKSTYFWNDALPSDAPSTIDTYITANPTHNYVTEAVNKLNDIVITPKRLWVTDGSDTENVSFNQLMQDLKDIFAVWWYIDDDGDFRLEHIKYFIKKNEDPTGIDLTSSAYSGYKPETDARLLTYDKSLIFNREQFEWNEADGEDFIGKDIIYDSVIETSDQVFKYNVANITMEVDWVKLNPSTANDTGYMLLQTEKVGTDFEVRLEIGAISGNLIINGHFSLANLQNAYWRWDRFAQDATMNGSAITFDSVRRYLFQANIRFAYQSNLDPFAKITTLQGGGMVDSLKHELDTDFYTVKLLYDVY